MSQHKRSHITRATVANITADDLCERILAHNKFWSEPGKTRHPIMDIAATVTASTGVFDGKIEQGVTIETTASWGTFALFIIGLLEDLNEDSAYIVEDGERAFLLLEDGTLEDI